MNPLLWSFRARALLAFVVCLGLLGFALYSQLHDGLIPCPLCIFQRIAFCVVALVFLVAGLHAPDGLGARRTYAGLALLVSVIGFAIAARQVWLQHLPPDQVPMCGPGLNYLVEAMPLTSVIRKVLTGSGECAKVDWTFLGASMAEWSCAWFAALGVWALLLMRRTR